MLDFIPAVSIYLPKNPFHFKKRQQNFKGSREETDSERDTCYDSLTVHLAF